MFIVEHNPPVYYHTRTCYFADAKTKAKKAAQLTSISNSKPNRNGPKAHAQILKYYPNKPTTSLANETLLTQYFLKLQNTILLFSTLCRALNYMLRDSQELGGGGIC